MIDRMQTTLHGKTVLPGTVAFWSLAEQAGRGTKVAVTVL